MSSNKISKTEDSIKSLEIKTKEEEKKLFKDDVLDKFNFWIYVGFIILGLILLISFILLIYSIFSTSTQSLKPTETKVNINPDPIKIPDIKPIVNINPDPIKIPEVNLPQAQMPIPIIKKVEEPKPSFFSSWFGNSSKKSTPSSIVTSSSNINNKSSSLPTIDSTPTTNKNTSIFSSFSNIFSPITNRNNIPKPTDNKITGGKYTKRYKNYRNNYK